jgi:hypothetical protein
MINKIKLLIIELVLILLTSYLMEAKSETTDEITGMIELRKN